MIDFPNLDRLTLLPLVWCQFGCVVLFFGLNSVNMQHLDSFLMHHLCEKKHSFLLLVSVIILANEIKKNTSKL